MNNSKSNTFSTRLISSFFICILFLNDLIPFSRACTFTSNIELQHDLKIFSDNQLVEFKKQVENYPVESIRESIELSKVEKNEINLESSQLTMTASGPGQSETSGFSLNSTEGLVDEFTGDFSYSIPLMDIEGYPLVLKYNSNVVMNSDASWVGLGWDLNLGAIARDMRGIPDEFNGDQQIVRTISEKLDETTEGKKFGPFVGFGKVIGGCFTPSVQVTTLFGNYQNSILGFGKTFDFGLQAQFSLSNENETATVGTAFGFGYNRDSKNGVGLNNTFSISGGLNSKNGGLGASVGGSLTYGSSYSSRKGLISRSFSWEASGGFLKKSYENITEDKFCNQRFANNGYDAGGGTGSTVTYGTATSMPKVGSNMIGADKSFGATASVGFLTTNNWMFTVGLTYRDYQTTNQLTISNNQLIQPAFGFLHSGKRNGYNTEGHYPIMDFNRSSETPYSENMKDLSFSIQTFDIFYVNAMGINGTFRARRDDFGTYYDPTNSTKVNEKLPVGSLDNLQDITNLVSNLENVDNVDVSAGVNLKYPAPPQVKLFVGMSAGFMPGGVESGVMKEENGANVLEFTAETDGEQFDNSVYFKSVGEVTPESLSAFNALNGSNSDCFKLESFFNVNEEKSDIRLTNKLIGLNTAIESSTLNNLNGASIERPFTATIFKPKIASDFPTNSFYEDAPIVESSETIETINRIGGFREANHISAVEVISTDGTKYNYGIPAYNISNAEISFAAQNLAIVTDNPSLVTYNPNASIPPNAPNNGLGWTEHYDRTVMPAYAHSFLLTEMTSSDYIDRSGNGPSLDDVGSYYKFNYSRLYGDGSNSFNWRYPVSGGSTSEAMLSKGLLGSELDDMAHYTYGEKEIWYAQSLESKNLIAEFVLEDRWDAYSVIDENGGLDTDKPLKLLKEIRLYNRAEKLANPNTAKPLQTVVFDYDYSLCLLNPSNKFTYTGPSDKYKSGKLTLKSVKVYNGESEELGLSKYEFEYNTTTNPDFNYSNVDGWGNYKENDPARPNDLYPYAEQDGTVANTNINAYKLVAINNPIGGRIEIGYEADRYSYVQNQRAMRYIDVEGMTNLFELLNFKNDNVWNASSNGSMTPDFTSSYSYPSLLSLLGGGNSADEEFLENSLFGDQTNLPYTANFGTFDRSFIPNNVLIFKLEEPIGGTSTLADAENLVKKRYFNDPLKGPNDILKDLYFKINVDATVNSTTINEMVACVAHVSNNFTNIFNTVPADGFNDDVNAIGVMPKSSSSADYEYGYVIVDPVNSGAIEKLGKKGTDKGGIMLHPLQRMALDFMRINLPDVIYGSCPGCTPNLEVDNKVAFGDDIYQVMLEDGDFAPTLLSASTVRLFEHDNVKFGGNSRVKEIKYLDNWTEMSTEYASTYSWTYSYVENSNVGGVASYEARSIVDENPFYFWDTYLNFNKNFPDESKFTPMPIADALFPAPVVGYQEVKVEFSGGTTHGHSLSKFYTSKEFPTISRKSIIDNSAKVKLHNKLSGKSLDLFGFSQGYFVQTNDFHGKPNETILYNKKGEKQARTTYHYYGLGEKILMMDRSTNMTQEAVALEYDMHCDSKYITDFTKLTNIGLKLTWTIPSPLPIPSPTFFMTSRERGFFSNALIKHINYSAVVKDIETEYMGSINTAENLLYDKYTGNTLLSSLKDEFNDKLYSLNYPSHWYYENLRDLCTVDYSSFSGTVTDGVFSNLSIDLSENFATGDKLNIVPSGGGSPVTVWVLEVNQNSLSLITVDGSKFSSTGTFNITLNTSNRENRINETMQKIVTKDSPLSSGNTVFTFPEYNIISSSAATYTTRNNVRCGVPGFGEGETPNNEISENSVVNPFLYGCKGDLYIDQQYAWQDERAEVGTIGIRKDGIYASSVFPSNPLEFYPFYKYNDGVGIEGWYKVDDADHPQYEATDPDHFQKWRDLGKITMYDEYGKVLENKDQLDIYSSVLYGYNSALNIVPVAQAINAPQQNLAFDGFEDYLYYPTFQMTNDETHFDFKESLTAGIEVQSVERHSGLSALKISPNTTAEVTKEIGVRLCDNDFSGIVEGEFYADECLCIKPFEPTPDDYIISVWIKEEDALIKETFTYGSVNVLIDDVLVSGGPFLPTGNIIDGWQRLEGTFTILPDVMNEIKIQLKNTSSNIDVYFDDFRIHPVLAGMTTVVYDPETLLPMATHDGYNFTTFLNYDENLNQVRVKVETERGIQTVSEVESGTFKTN